MALLNITLDIVQNEFKKEEPQWFQSHWNDSDAKFLQEECNKDSEFDPTNVRKSLIKNINDSTVLECTYGKIHVIYDNSLQKYDIPWGLWGRILRLYSHKKPFKVFFLAGTNTRQFPKPLPNGDFMPITPYNINGGYTYPCNHETIVIYRAEDATRVLIHELQHSCCLDNHALGIDRVEAETEAWAELIYCALLSRGVHNMFHKLLQKQSTWIQCQNNRVRNHLKSPMGFPWRYTIGKEEVWRRWNILQPLRKLMYPTLRLTYPPSNDIKTFFKVSKRSTIL
jgi:hypothetical protein